MWLIFVSRRQNDWALFIITLLQVSTYISLVRSREKIRLLLNKLSKISRIFLSVRKWRLLRISVLAYYVIMFSMDLHSQIVYFSSRFREYIRYDIHHTTSVSEKLKHHFIFIIDIFWVSVVMAHVMIGTFIGYYSYVCICIKSCVDKFVLISETLISQCDYQSLLSFHEDISQVMALANEFLPYPVFINVLCNMGALFAFSYIVTFYPPDDRMVYFMEGHRIIHSLMSLFLLMIPAAGCNRALNLLQLTIKYLPGWFPQHRKALKMHIRRRLNKTFPLTLWNIYVIDEPLLISAFGTLLTYGFLLGNIKIPNN
ncbi:uncharacterized protein NPIL_307601 [Nephila pilipes]|uniref:Uncharacterized protein n=1 Tax=Nephila pilipes TaxID=299642 RepID=A0A8X6PLY5_NEPPI|nr:uncharacterized protein NPIL_307601 [Nephila pilipes]